MRRDSIRVTVAVHLTRNKRLRPKKDQQARQDRTKVQWNPRLRDDIFALENLNRTPRLSPHDNYSPCGSFN
jgi:hypothetical protein